MSSTPGASRFDVTANDAEYRRQFAAVRWTLRVAGPIIILLGLLFLLVITTPERYVGVFLLGLAGYAIWSAFATNSLPLTSLECDSTGLRLRSTQGLITAVTWDAPPSAFRVIDFSEHVQSLGRIPASLIIEKRAWGISREAVAAVLTMAQYRGLTVSQVPVGTEAQSPTYVWKVSRPGVA